MTSLKASSQRSACLPTTPCAVRPSWRKKTSKCCKKTYIPLPPGRRSGPWSSTHRSAQRWESHRRRTRPPCVWATWTEHWKCQHYQVPGCHHSGQHVMGIPYWLHHKESQQNPKLYPAQPQDWQQEDKGNCVQSPCSPTSWVCSPRLGSVHSKRDWGPWKDPTKSSKMGRKSPPPNIMCGLHPRPTRLASPATTLRESPSGDVL